jgi:hypothetical protein
MSVKHTIAEKEFTACFAHLENLEQVLKKDEFLYGLFDGVDWIKRICQECQKMASLFDRIYALLTAVLDGDFDRAYSIIDEVSNIDPSDMPMELDLDKVTAMMRPSTEFECLAREIENAKTLNDPNKMRELNTNFMNKWTNNKPVHMEEIEIFIAQNLGWLIQESINNLRWQEGLEICDEGLEYYNSSNEETSFKRTQLQNLKESCEVGLVIKSLAEAEAAGDLSACLEYLSRLEGLGCGGIN